MGDGKRKKAVSAIIVIAVSLAMVISIEALSFQTDVSFSGMEKAIQDHIHIQADRYVYAFIEKEAFWNGETNYTVFEMPSYYTASICRKPASL